MQGQVKQRFREQLIDNAGARLVLYRQGNGLDHPDRLAVVVEVGERNGSGYIGAMQRVACGRCLVMCWSSQ